MQFTIETRPLTNEKDSRSVSGGQSTHTVIEATDPQAAIAEFVRQNQSELVSFATPATGRELIATVRKEDSVFLVRVYEN